MLHFDDIVFGPIVSRRLGSSLGVNLLPSKGKLCNFDCVYCECGWNRDGVSDGRFPSLEVVEDALNARIPRLAAEGVRIDSITFSGNGEPTLNPDFPEIIDAVIRLRDEYFPSAKVSVLSNATMLHRKPVLDALKKVDNPIMKIDASSDRIISLINKPRGSYSLDDVLGQLEGFNGNFILQTMFLQSPQFEISEQEIEDWRNIVRRLRPKGVMVYTIDRETPDSSLSKCTMDRMKTITAPLVEEGFDVSISG